MSDNMRSKRACKRKIAYANAGLAREARAYMQRTGWNVERLVVYQCPACQCWHLGHAMSQETSDEGVGRSEASREASRSESR